MTAQSSAVTDDDLFIVEVLPDPDEAMEIVWDEYAMELTLRARLDALHAESRCRHEIQEPRTYTLHLSRDWHEPVMQCLTCGGLCRFIHPDELALCDEALANGAFDEVLAAAFDTIYYRKERARQDEIRDLESQIRRCRRAQYDAYLLTDDWRDKRRERLIVDDHQCQLRLPGCLGKASQVHHVTYDRLFAEELEDLLSVCQPCHQKRHAHAGRRSV
jgi:hypothetical protein